MPKKKKEIYLKWINKYKNQRYLGCWSCLTLGFFSARRLKVGTENQTKIQFLQHCLLFCKRSPLLFGKPWRGKVGETLAQMCKLIQHFSDITLTSQLKRDERLWDDVRFTRKNKLFARQLQTKGVAAIVYLFVSLFLIFDSGWLSVRGYWDIFILQGPLSVWDTDCKSHIQILILMPNKVAAISGLFKWLYTVMELVLLGGEGGVGGRCSLKLFCHPVSSRLTHIWLRGTENKQRGTATERDNAAGVREPNAAQLKQLQVTPGGAMWGRHTSLHRLRGKVSYRRIREWFPWRGHDQHGGVGSSEAPPRMYYKGLDAAVAIWRWSNFFPPVATRGTAVKKPGSPKTSNFFFNSSETPYRMTVTCSKK